MAQQGKLVQVGRFRFEVIEHTADKAIVALGESYPEMLESAAAGMFAQQVELENVPQARRWTVMAEGDSAEDLLVAWLRELLFLSEDENVSLGEFKITKFTEWQVEGEVWGSDYTPAVKRTGAAVKAITYHQLAVEYTTEWRGQVTFDV